MVTYERGLSQFGPSRRRILLGLAAASAVPVTAAAETGLTIAAAADVRQALDAIVGLFETANGSAKVRVTYGSSGNLARQIAQAAPFELFLSADEAIADRLIAEGYAEGPGFVYGVGRLALIVRRDSPIEVERGIAGIADAVSRKQIIWFAIANPVHAPYGERAKEVLEKSGLWGVVGGQLRLPLLLGENVAVPAQYVITGAAEAGITALSLVKSGDAATALRYSVIPAELHAPLRQRMVLTRSASPAARALYAYIASAEAQAILRASGFEQP